MSSLGRSSTEHAPVASGHNSPLIRAGVKSSKRQSRGGPTPAPWPGWGGRPPTAATAPRAAAMRDLRKRRARRSRHLSCLLVVQPGVVKYSNPYACSCDESGAQAPVHLDEDVASEQPDHQRARSGCRWMAAFVPIRRGDADGALDGAWSVVAERSVNVRRPLFGVAGGCSGGGVRGPFERVGGRGGEVEWRSLASPVRSHTRATNIAHRR